MISLIVRKLFYLHLAVFYGTLVVLGLVYLHFKSCFKYLINRVDYSKRPVVLDEPKIGKHHTVKINGKVIHYVANGDPDDDLIVFLHGFPDFWFTWREQLKEFGSNGYYAVAIDLPGYGESSKFLEPGQGSLVKVIPDLAKVIQSLRKSDDQKVILVGHDWGAAIAYYLAANYTDLITKLVILNGAHPTHFYILLRKSCKQFFMSWYMIFFSLPCVPEWAFQTLDYFGLKATFRDGDHKPIFNSEDLKPWKYIYNQPGAIKSALSYYRDNIKIDTPVKKNDGLRITQPLLVIWGDKDFALSSELATGVAKYADNLSLRIVKGCSHFVHLEKPHYINLLIREFV